MVIKTIQINLLRQSFLFFTIKKNSVELKEWYFEVSCMNYYLIDKTVQDIDINIIRLSCTIQLKVLLVALKEEFKKKFNAEQIATELKKEVSEVEEAIDFWVNLKIIKNLNNKNEENLKLNIKN